MTIQLDIYKFILEGIRKEDARTGFFLQRFLEGPQQQWEDTQSRMFELLELWDVVNVEDANLQFLKQQVGWTPDLNNITDKLTDDALRKLIDNSIDIWKFRGTEDIIQDILFFVTETRNRLENWFFFRWLLDERAYGDIWLTDDDKTMLIKLVDDGTVDTDLVVNVLEIMRPASATFRVVYHHFLDYFGSDNDGTQWSYSGTPLEFVDDTMKSTHPGGYALVNVPGTLSWDNYAYSADINMISGIGGVVGSHDFRMIFHYEDANNYRWIRIWGSNTENRMITLYRKIAGADTMFGDIVLRDLGYINYSEVYSNFRIELIDEGVKQRIRVYFDENEILSVADSTTTSGGTVGFWFANSQEVHIKAVEVRPIPATFDTVS